MRKKGSITIYLCIVLISIIIVVNVICEGARLSSVQAQIKSYTYMSTESVLAGYGRQIYEDYGILLVWESKKVEATIKKNIQDNINMADLNIKGANLLGTNLVKVEVFDKEYLTSKGGVYFSKQINSYVKYAGAMKAVDELVKEYKKYKKNKEEKYICDVNVVDKSMKELQEIVENINKDIAELQKIEDLSSKHNSIRENMEKAKNNSKKKYIKKILKEYKELMTGLDNKEKDVDRVIALIETYEGKKVSYLAKNDYTFSAKDYMDDNLNVLKKVRDNIEENKKLNVFQTEQLDSYKEEELKKSLANVKDIFGKIKSLTTPECTDEDDKNYSIFEKAKDLLDTGVLSLVIENPDKISKNTISGSNLPTNLENNKKTNLSESITDKGVNAIYINEKFGNYLDNKKDTALKYEVEYIIGGKSSDKKNLTNTMEKLVVARTGINTAYLLTDKEKMGEISAVATSVSAVTGIPFLNPVAKTLLTGAWSMAEAINDVKSLLDGGKVPILKDKNNWKTSLKGLSGEKVKSDTGSTYSQYCQILIMTEKNADCIYRMMDLIQVNVKKRYNSDFLMSKCLTGFRIKANYETAPLFTAMPMVINNLSQDSNAYKYCVEYYNSY